MSGCFPLISSSLFVSISVCVSFFSSDACSYSRPLLGPDGRGLDLSSSLMRKFGSWFLPALAPRKFTRRQQAFNEVSQAVRRALPLVPTFLSLSLQWVVKWGDACNSCTLLSFNQREDTNHSLCCCYSGDLLCFVMQHVCVSHALFLLPVRQMMLARAICIYTNWIRKIFESNSDVWWYCNSSQMNKNTKLANCM